MRTVYRIVGCLATAGESGRDGASGKVGKYAADAEAHGFRFQPAGCETFGAPGAGLMAFVEDIAAHAAAEGGSAGAGWGAATVREYAWQAVAVGRVRGIAAALHESAQRRVREDRRRRSPGVLSLPSAPVGRVAAAEEDQRLDLRRRRAASRQAARSATRSSSVLSLARPLPVIPAQPAVGPPLAAAVVEFLSPAVRRSLFLRFQSRPQERGKAHRRWSAPR